MERKLIAILVGDVVGYSRLVGRNETQTIDSLRACFSLVRDCIEDHRGSVFSSAGDSILAEFKSAVDAVRCAIEVQDLLTEINEGIFEDRALLMRFGINLGDVIVDGDNYLGDGVNVAARLEPLAPPGGICLSDSVYQNVAGRIEARFEDLGSLELKNIDRPIHAYCLRSADAPETPAINPATSKTVETTDAPAIAVLPFDNMSNDPEDEYFVDGLTEDLITALAAWRTFPVIARNSTFAYKCKSPDIRTVAQELKARYILEGSVRKAGSRIRVNAQLIDAATGHHTWAEKFDRDIEGIFDVQDEITSYLAGIVAPELDKAEQRRIETTRPSSLQVWELLQRGMYFLDLWTQADNEHARKLFNQVLELDPNYAQALVGLAYTHHREIWFNFSDDRDGSIRELIRTASRAVKIDPYDSMAYCLRGFGYMWLRKFDLSVAEGERAVSLNPSNFVALAQLGLSLCYAGRPLEGLPKFEQSIRVSPRNPRIHFIQSCVARAHLAARDPAAAASAARDALAHEADYPLALLILASALGHIDESVEARAALESCERAQPGFAVKWASTPMFKNREDDLFLLEGLRKAGLEASVKLAT